MPQLGSFLLSVARDLNDAEPGHEFTRWSKQQLIDYVNEALSLITLFKPEYITNSHVLRLVQGSEQQACDCQTLLRVIGQCDQYGSLLEGFLPKRASAVQYRWTKPACPPRAGGDFHLTGYTHDATMGTRFTVTPPVPPGVEVNVKIECVDKPTPLTLGSTKSDFGYDNCQAAIRQWALFRAHSVDDESATSMAAAKQALTTFFMLVQTQFTRELLQQLGLSATPEVKETLSILRSAGMIGRSA